MAIEFICPSCQGTLAMPDEAAGRLVRCGNCLATLRVPDAPPTAPPYDTVEPLPPLPAEPDRDDRDEYGEPRPRKPRKKKKKGRSPLFWIMLTLLGIGLFACLACGGVMVMLGTARWQKFDSERGQFTVDLPAPVNPQIDREARAQFNLKDFQVEGTMLVGRVELYWVWYKDIPAVRRKDDDQLLENAIKQLQDFGTLQNTTAKTVDGCQAREVVIRNDADGQFHHCLVVIGKTKVYIVAAGGPFLEAQPNPRVRRFLDSFRPK